MFTSLLVYAVFLALMFGSLVLWGVFLWIGLRWAKVPHAAIGRIAVVTAVTSVAQLAIAMACRIPTPASGTEAMLLALAEPVGSMLFVLLTLALVFKIDVVQAFQAWLPTMIPSVAAVGVMFLLLRPYFCEAFAAPTNSMAPTLLGDHWCGVCPKCGRTAFCSPADERLADAEPPPMICADFHIAPLADSDRSVGPRDRFLVAKFVQPQRWDLVVFRYPEQPDTFFVKRLVGLPGETIEIADGAVWANGQRLTPPDAIRGIEYASELPDLRFRTLWGTRAQPAVLGNDEYFMLGDFTVRANDSRLWRQGAEGHHPYAVPASYISGVVTSIYWPPSRWRTFR